MGLEEIGYNDWFRDQVGRETSLCVARVMAVHKGACDLIDGESQFEAKMSGRMRHQAKSKLDYPTVGDWVLVKDADNEQGGQIQQVLKRQSALCRKTAGRRAIQQLIAANLDAAFIMQTLGPGFNVRRIERYLVMVNESGIRPIVLLSKSDLVDAEEMANKRKKVQALMPDLEVFAFSNEDHYGIDAVEALFLPQKTYCFIGTSGVGKTSLLNTLLGDKEALFTLPVREKDGKGVHSTTWRELITLDNGSMIIDTPGMRELGNLNAEEGISETFDDITELSASCRFSDCAHSNTLGCAVIEAVERGDLSSKRYNSFIRLRDEAEAHQKAFIEKKQKERDFKRFHRSLKPNRRRKK